MGFLFRGLFAILLGTGLLIRFFVMKRAFQKICFLKVMLLVTLHYIFIVRNVFAKTSFVFLMKKNDILIGEN